MPSLSFSGKSLGRASAPLPGFPSGALLAQRLKSPGCPTAPHASVTDSSTLVDRSPSRVTASSTAVRVARRGLAFLVAFLPRFLVAFLPRSLVAFLPRFLPRSLVAFSLVLVLAGGCTLAWLAIFPLPPDGAPRVVLSLDNQWHFRLGWHRLTYGRLLRRGGLRYVATFPDSKPEHVQELLSDASGIVLGGGGDVDPSLYENAQVRALDVDPARDALEAVLHASAGAERIPLLGVCRGAQLINVLRGGSLKSLREDATRARSHRRLDGHAVSVAPGSQMHNMLGQTTLSNVFSWHGQAVDKLAPGLHASGHARDGILEAFEGADLDEHFVVGLQWHPELQISERPEHKIVHQFARAVRTFASSH